MSSGDDAVNALREALKHSPDNTPLRMHLADTLMGLGRHEDAEKEYRLGLSQSGGDDRFKLGLAALFSRGRIRRRSWSSRR